MKRVLITGTSGWIGNALARSMSSEYCVIGLDPLINSENLSIFTSINGVASNFLESPYSKSKIDLIIHIGALVSPSESVNRTYEYFEKNFIETMKLLKYSSRNEIPFIFMSSASVYEAFQFKPELELYEDGEIFPMTPYATFKRAIELELKESRNRHENCSIRLFNPVGNFFDFHIGFVQKKLGKDLFSQILLKIKKAIKENKKETDISIRGNNFQTLDGTAVRDFIDINDVISALKKIALLGNFNEPILNLGSGVPHTVLQVVNKFSAASGIILSPNFEPPGHGDVAGGYANIDKIIQTADWKPKISLDETISTLIENIDI